MRRTLELMAAPPGLQPGGYVPQAYADRNTLLTRTATIRTERTDAGWHIELEWECPDPVSDASTDTNRFADAAALLVPLTDDAPWISMGAPDEPVEGALWRADRPSLHRIRAEGLGTAERSEPPAEWSATGTWRDGHWHVVFELGAWAGLDDRRRLAVAVWRGSVGDRGGLKSVTAGWIALEG